MTCGHFGTRYFASLSLCVTLDNAVAKQHICAHPSGGLSAPGRFSGCRSWLCLDAHGNQSRQTFQLACLPSGQSWTHDASMFVASNSCRTLQRINPSKLAPLSALLLVILGTWRHVWLSPPISAAPSGICPLAPTEHETETAILAPSCSSLHVPPDPLGAVSMLLRRKLAG